MQKCLVLALAPHHLTGSKMVGDPMKAQSQTSRPPKRVVCDIESDDLADDISNIQQLNAELCRIRALRLKLRGLNENSKKR
jgi:hypothetical protein